MRQFRELTRLFFGRFFDNDVICLDGDTRNTFVGIFSLLAAPGLFLPFFEFLRFSSWPLGWQPLWVRDLTSIPDKVVHCGLSMAVLGIVTVLQWDALIPDRRDTAVLRPLPVPLVTLFAAKVSALFGFWALFTAAVSGLSTVLFPLAVTVKATAGQVLWWTTVHAGVVLAGNAFIFSAMLAVQGLLLHTLGWSRYRRLAPAVQAFLIAGLLMMFFASLAAAFSLRIDRPATTALLALPPLWFLGLYQTGLGWTQPLFQQLAGQARFALLASILVAVAAYALSYRRSLTGAFEQVDGAAGSPGFLRRIFAALANRLWVRSPGERAAFYFVLQTLARSRPHRVLVAAYAGFGFALVFHSLAGLFVAGSRPELWKNPGGPLLAAPLVLSLFVVAGLRYAFTVPSELRANWLFQLGAVSGPGPLSSGARKAAATVAVAPLFGVLTPAYVYLWGWQLGLLHIGFGVAVTLLLLDTLLLTFDKLPFACSYAPGNANLKGTWPLYIAGYLIYVAALSGLEYVLLADPWRFVWFGMAVLAVKAGIEFLRRRHLAGGFELEYDARPEPAVRTLELQQ